MLRFAFMRAGRSACSTMCDWSRRQAWRALRALACGCSLWSAGLTITIGIAIDARQPVLAQQQEVGPLPGASKEQRASRRREYTKYAIDFFKIAEALSRKICDVTDNNEKLKLSLEWKDANAALDEAIYRIIEYSEDLTKEERTAIESERKARKELNPFSSPEARAAWEKARQERNDKLRKRYEDIKAKIEAGEEISYTLECPSYATLPLNGPTITVSGELGWGGSRNGFEDYDFSGSGIIGGVSGQFNVPIGAGTYAGLGVSILASGVSGSTSDPITSNVQLLVPIDAIVGTTFRPAGSHWPVSVYGFGGLAIGDVHISAPPFSATQIMTGWSVGVGGEVQISPNWSVGLKYRHFDLGNANFSVFPGGTSLVSERGDMVTGTLSYHFSILPPALIAPMVTK